jgi:hypothetical protein
MVGGRCEMRNLSMLRPNVQVKAARATAEPTNQHNARGACSLFDRRIGICYALAPELRKLRPELRYFLAPEKNLILAHFLAALSRSSLFP